jgi:hypothetical protein
MQRQHQIGARGQQINAGEQSRGPRIVVEEDDEVEEGEQEVGHVEQSLGTFSGMAPVQAALTAPPLQHAASHKGHTLYIYDEKVFLVFISKFYTEKQNLRAEFKETVLFSLKKLLLILDNSGRAPKNRFCLVILIFPVSVFVTLLFYHPSQHLLQINDLVSFSKNGQVFILTGEISPRFRRPSEIPLLGRWPEDPV